MRFKLHLFVFLLTACCLQDASGQSFTQVSVGHYSRVNALFLNPSMPAGSKLRWQLYLGGFWVNANNTYLTLKMPYSLYRLPGNAPTQYRTEYGNPVFQKTWLQENLNGRVKQVSASSDIAGPAFSMGYRTWSFAVFSSASAAVRLNDFPEDLAHALLYELDSSQGAFSLFNRPDNGQYTSGTFSGAGHSRAAFGVNISKSVKLRQYAKLLVGASVKRVIGMQGFYIQNNGISAAQLAGDSMRLLPGSMQLVTYNRFAGRGTGADVGATLVLHKKDNQRNGNYAKTRTDYFLKLGFSLMDLGRIRYSDAEYRNLTTSDTVFSHRGLYTGDNGLETLDSFFNAAGSLSRYRGDLLVGLPGRMVVSADMQFMKHVFLSGVWSQSLRKRHSVHARYQSFFMVSPRLEYRFFEFSLPLILEYDYRALRMGASVRFGPFFIGSNSIGSLVRTRSVSDADVFAGVVVSEFALGSLRLRGGKSGGRGREAQLKCAEF